MWFSGFRSGSGSQPSLTKLSPSLRLSKLGWSVSGSGSVRTCVFRPPLCQEPLEHWR